MKNKYEIFNETKIDEDKYKSISINKEEKEDMKKRLKSKIKTTKNKRYKKIAVATIPIVVAGGLILSSETAQAYIEGIGKQIEYFLDKNTEELSGYKTSVNKAISDKNIEITLNEIMLRDGELLLSLRIDDSKLDKKSLGIEEDSAGFIYEPIVQIGDMKFLAEGYSITMQGGDDGGNDILLKYELSSLDTNNDDEVDIKNFDIIKNIDINQDYNVKIFLDKLEYQLDSNAKISDEITISSSGGGVIDTGEYSEHQNGYIKGDWTFETTLNGSKMLENIDIYNIDKNYKLENKNTDIDVNVKEVRVAPTTVKVKYTFKVNKQDDSYMFNTISFILKDEKGKIIEPSDGVYGLEYKGNECRTTFEINKDLKKLTFIPIVEYSKEKSDKTFKFKNQAIKLDLTK